ncbi:Polysialic acid O-acetyltransferase-like 2, partial [Homarus americanus]
YVKHLWHSRPGTQDLALKTWYSRPGTPDLALKTWHSRPGTQDQALQTWHSRPGTQDQALQTWHSRPGTQDLVLKTWHSRPGTYRIPKWRIVYSIVYDLYGRHEHKQCVPVEVTGGPVVTCSRCPSDLQMPQMRLTALTPLMWFSRSDRFFGAMTW